jgi:iron complex transport system substrate-binding protein
MSRNKVYVVILVTVVLIASISVVCLTNKSGQSDSPENGSTQNTVTVVDLANRTVTLDVPVETVVLGSPELVNAFVAVTGDDFASQIVGVSSMFKLMYFDLYEVYTSEHPGFADIIQVGSCYDGSFSVETIVSLNPDVLLLPVWAITMDMVPDLNALDAAGIPYMFLDFYVDPYDGYSYTQSASLIGTLVGKEERAENIVNFYNEQLDAVFDVLNSLNTSYPTPTVYLEYPDAGTSNYGQTMVDMGMSVPLTYARAYNIARDAIGGYGGTINGEFLLDANPDVIMFCVARTLSSSGGDLVGFGAYPSTDEVQTIVSAYLERDGWDTLDAVKNEKVYFWCSEVGFSINSFSVLQYMAKWIYPELFTTLDPLQNLQDFYTEFMPIPLDGTWTFSSEVLG